MPRSHLTSFILVISLKPPLSHRINYTQCSGIRTCTSLHAVIPYTIEPILWSERYNFWGFRIYNLSAWIFLFDYSLKFHKSTKITLLGYISSCGECYTYKHMVLIKYNAWSWPWHIVMRKYSTPLYWLIGAKDQHDYVCLLRKVTFAFIRNNSLCKINHCRRLFGTKKKLQVGKEFICMNSLSCCGTPVWKSD